MKAFTIFNKHLQKVLISIFLVLIFPNWAWAQTLTINAERQTVELGDIINLIIEADFQTSSSPLDLIALNHDFEVLGTQQSNNIEIYNGIYRSKTRWQISLMAKQSGDITIPALRVDSSTTQPYIIKVLPNKPKQPGQLEPYFLESSIDKQEVYVQQQVLYRLRLNYLGSITGNMHQPTFGEALTEVVKEQSVYGRLIKGKQYTVYEWLYAIYPQKSGTLVIPGPQFTGLHQYQGRQKGVQETAKSQTITVLAEPTSFSQQANNVWLPASKVVLSESWESPTKQIRVGDSLTRTLKIEASQLTASQLPNLVTPNGDNFRVYAEQPLTQQKIKQSGVWSQLQTKQVIITTQLGKLQLPAQTIQWWNTQTNQLETTQIAEQIFTILPALKSTNSTALPIKQTVNQAVVVDNESPLIQQDLNLSGQQYVSHETLINWGWVSLILILVIVFILWRWYKNHLQMTAIITDLKSIEIEPVKLAQTWLRPNLTLCDKHNRVNKALSPIDFYNRLCTELKEKFDIGNTEDITLDELRTAVQALEAHLFHSKPLSTETLKIVCTLLVTFTNQQTKINKSVPENSSKLLALYSKK